MCWHVHHLKQRRTHVNFAHVKTKKPDRSRAGNKTEILIPSLKFRHPNELQN